MHGQSPNPARGRSGRRRFCTICGTQSDPVPYGRPFPAILCRSTQEPRKPWPTGHRFAEVVGGRRARQNPQLRKPPLERVCRDSCRESRGGSQAAVRDVCAENGRNCLDAFDENLVRQQEGTRREAYVRAPIRARVDDFHEVLRSEPPKTFNVFAHKVDAVLL